MWALALQMELGPHKETQRITLTRVGIEPTTFGGRYVMYGELLCTQYILYHFIHIMSYIRLCTAIQDYIHQHTAKQSHTKLSGSITAAQPTELHGHTLLIQRNPSFFYQPTWQRNIFLILIGGYVEFIVNPVDLIYRLFITEIRFRKVRVTILLLIFD